MKAPVLAIAIPHHSGDEPSDEPDGDEGGDAEEIAHQIAEMCGVAEEDRGRFAKLLEAYHHACEMEPPSKGDESKDEEDN